MTSLLPDQIDTHRLRLRKPEMIDARAIFQGYTQDPEVCRFMVWTPHVSEAATEKFVEFCIGSWATEERRPYVIAARETDIAIGMVEARMLGTAMDIGYVLARSYWGDGLMPEAVSALASLALENSRIYRVQATCDSENIPSQRVLEKSGFTREGRLERYTIHPNLSPEPRACFMYARCR